tara:strand:- start:65 stop:241 length:177 start_codon:yes stop_codon:yes gene_type:complete
MNNTYHYYIDEVEAEMPTAKRPKLEEALIDYEFEEDEDVFQLSESFAQLKLRPMKRKR